MLLLALSACSKDRDNNAENNPLSYQATKLPDDIHKFYDAKGDNAADTVWVFLQGGPDMKKNFELEPESTEGKDYDFFLDDLRVYPHRLNTSTANLPNTPILNTSMP